MLKLFMRDFLNFTQVTKSPSHSSLVTPSSCRAFPSSYQRQLIDVSLGRKPRLEARSHVAGRSHSSEPLLRPFNPVARNARLTYQNNSRTLLVNRSARRRGPHTCPQHSRVICFVDCTVRHQFFPESRLARCDKDRIAHTQLRCAILFQLLSSRLRRFDPYNLRSSRAWRISRACGLPATVFVSQLLT